MTQSSKKKVAVIGLGYIGLPTAALLANAGNQVLGVDISHDVVETLNRGDIHIVEPDLEVHVRANVSKGRLKASMELEPADVFIICVPTPFHSNDGDPIPDTSFVINAALSIAEYIKSGDILILESTSPVGTTEVVFDLLKSKGVNVDDVHIAYCPERVLPGKIMIELLQNDRIVGGVDKKSTRYVADFYRTFVRGEILETDSKTAEMCKLTENSFRDVNIAFANELSMVCESEGVDVWELIRLANHHPRVNILQPGAGVGGHCIAVDPWFIVSRDNENAKLIRCAREVNDSKPEWVIDRIVKQANSLAKVNPKIACLGLAFKPDIDDLRESPASIVARGLMARGLDVVCVEPNIEEHAGFVLTSLDEALERADVIAILVGHKEFGSESVKLFLSNSGAIDFCGVLS